MYFASQNLPIFIFHRHLSMEIVVISGKVILALANFFFGFFHLFHSIYFWSFFFPLLLPDVHCAYWTKSEMQSLWGYQITLTLMMTSSSSSTELSSKLWHVEFVRQHRIVSFHSEKRLQIGLQRSQTMFAKLCTSSSLVVLKI